MKLVWSGSSRAIFILLSIVFCIRMPIVQAVDWRIWESDVVAAQRIVKRIGEKIKDIDFAIDKVIDGKVNTQLPKAADIFALCQDLKSMINKISDKKELEKIRTAFKQELLEPLQMISGKLTRFAGIIATNSIDELIEGYKKNFEEIKSLQGEPFDYKKVYNALGLKPQEGVKLTWAQAIGKLKEAENDLLDAANEAERLNREQGVTNPPELVRPIKYKFRQIEFMLRDALAKKIYDLVLQYESDPKKVVDQLLPNQQVKDKIMEFFTQIVLDPDYIQGYVATIGEILSDKLRQ